MSLGVSVVCVWLAFGDELCLIGCCLRLGGFGVVWFVVVVFVSGVLAVCVLVWLLFYCGLWALRFLCGVGVRVFWFCLVGCFVFFLFDFMRFLVSWFGFDGS